MALPLPNLDTRVWADMTAEALALIPRYAPEWTDFNVHDPGITLIELLAWLVEQDIYRVNRVTVPSRLKFLSLIGFAPLPASPASVSLTFTHQAAIADVTLPQGLAFAPVGVAPAPAFLLTAPLTVVAAQIQAVQVFDGAAFSDQTQAWLNARPFPAFGANPAAPVSDPEQQPALYLAFDQSLPSGVTVSLGLQFQGTDEAQRARLIEETQRQATLCPPMPPRPNCPPIANAAPWCRPGSDLSTGSSPPTGSTPAATWQQHYAVSLVWDYYDGANWRSLDATQGEVVDETRGFTLNSVVSITLPTVMMKRSVGIVSGMFYVLRVRLTAGPPDVAPVLLDVGVNAALAEQSAPAWYAFTIQPNVLPPMGQELTPGTQARLALTFATDGTISALAVEPNGSGPEVTVLGYSAATATAPGSLSLTLMPLGTGAETPQQTVQLPGQEVDRGTVQIWTTVGLALTLQWRQQPDFDASQRIDTDFVQDATTDSIQFGDGEHGQVVPYGEWIFAAYSATQGSAGNLASGQLWGLADGLTDWNRQLLRVLGSDPVALTSQLQSVVNRLPGSGGADPETWESAAERAAATLWAHERLVELCPDGACTTLDQLPRASVLALQPPERALTLHDFERLALDVPGTGVVRARAWAGIDPNYPCLNAPGTITVVIVPGLPLQQPQPTAGLLQTVRNYLNARRALGTRLVVVGPEYVTVSVQATVVSQAQADPTRVQSDILTALAQYLNPIASGPAGYGWPFGRDVYRTEVFKVLHDVPGVDYVQSLELSADGQPAQCSNLCVGAVSLVTSGTHTIQVL